MEDFTKQLLPSSYSTPVQSQTEPSQTLSQPAISTGPPSPAPTAELPGPAPYRYKPLGPGEIRVLEILPHYGEGSEAISCSLSTVNIRDKDHVVQYEALSYCWRNKDGEEPNRIIMCDSRPVAVMQNLYDALERLRDAHKPKKLWADAICINQDELDERGAQVAMMREIYASSTRVVIWLGKEADGSSAGISLARELAALGRRYHQSPKPLRLREGRRLAPKLSDAPCNELFAILKRRWFYRVWVIQELSIAPDARIYCGPEEIEWADFVLAARFIAEVGWILMASSVHFVNNLVFLYNVRADFQDGIRPSLLSLLLRSSGSEATDNRDKIFSLLGLADDADVAGLKIQASYSIDPGALCRKYAFESLRRDGNLNILSAVRGDRVGGVPGLPSWVPDWTAEGMVPLITLQHLERPTVFLSSSRQARELLIDTNSSTRRTPSALW